MSVRPIHTILIANRGEIASRIIRTCRKMGIRTVAVYSDADRYAAFVEEADLAVHIGDSDPAESYLHQEKILTAAQQSGAQAIHPGYGFLSENAALARRCAAQGLLFIGPRPEAIAAMGSKSTAKALMEEHQLPVLPGYQGEDQSEERLLREAANTGFPLLLKAAAGGGGKGMRIVREEKELKAAISAARREARNAFGDEELIIEKYIESGRHIEVQIFGDRHGNLIHLLERECTIQRRYQKIVEESPSPVVDAQLRARLGAAALKAARALQYDNAGTVEFIYDQASGDFYFLEVNTRLQVEHPVTEAITGLDLVAMQIEIAQGLPLAIRQEQVVAQGYAIEVRLYAEDPSADFLPATGTVERFELPQTEGLRVETAIRSGDHISAYYDPMIAKLIVHEKDRRTALHKMHYVLQQLICLGTTTNQELLIRLLEKEEFLKGNYDTHFIEKNTDLKTPGPQAGRMLPLACIAAALHGWKERQQSARLLRSIPSGWRNSFYDYQKETFQYRENSYPVNYRFLNGQFQFQLNQTDYEVKLLEANDQLVRMEVDGMLYTFPMAKREKEYFLHLGPAGAVRLRKAARFPGREAEKIKGGFEAPLPSKIVKILVEEGQQVAAGDELIVLSSMKMETSLYAEEAGIVEELFAGEGSSVEAGFVLLKLKKI